MILLQTTSLFKDIRICFRKYIKYQDQDLKYLPIFGLAGVLKYLPFSKLGCNKNLIGLCPL